MYETDDMGYNWYVAPRTHDGMSAIYHEMDLIKWAMKRFPRGGLFLDVGANIGSYSIRLSKHFREVVAVEPHPVNTYMLKKNMELNNITNIHILELAASRNLAMMFFNQTDPNSLASAGSVDNAPNSNAVAPPFHVLGVPLDDYQLYPDFIKMDIEGGEYEAIYGLRETLARAKPVVLMEIHQFRDGRNVGLFQSIMAEFGYKCTEVLNEWQDKIFQYVYEYEYKD